MGLSVHDPFVDPLGNPLGLVQGGATALVFTGPALHIITSPGSGSLVVPKGAKNYRIVAIGGGAAGTSLSGGGSGAVAIKSGSIDKENFKISWVIGNAANAIAPSGTPTTVSGPGISLVAPGGFPSNYESAIASGGDVNYAGMRGYGNGETVPNATTTPAAGSGNAPTTLNGGGSGYAGGKGGNGLSSAYNGGASTPVVGVGELGLGFAPLATALTAFSGGNYVSGVKSGDGGIGGGGGGRPNGLGGIGMVRIELW